VGWGIRSGISLLKIGLASLAKDVRDASSQSSENLKTLYKRSSILRANLLASLRLQSFALENE
jgi:hypothetical protein